MRSPFPALTVSALASAAWAQPTIAPLGFQNPTYSAAAVSSDGAVVAGYAADGMSYYWRAGMPMQQLPWLDRPPSVAAALSADGSVIVGSSRTSAYEQRAFRWTASTGTVSLGTLGGTWSEAYAVSDDGAVVVGRSELAGTTFYRGFRWTAATGMTDLGALGGDLAAATGVSGDGNTVAGWSTTADGTTRAVISVLPGGLTTLNAPGAYASIARGISRDGRTAFGSITVPVVGGTRACRWVDGVYFELGTLGGNDGSALASTRSGKLLVGSSSLASGAERAFVWTQSDGMQLLSTFATAKGVSLTGWTLLRATGVSADGSVVTGDGAYNGFARPFVIRGLPAVQCAADLGVTGGVAGHDGVLDNNDFIVYIDLFFAGSVSADIGSVGGVSGADGTLDNNDFIVFIDNFFAGC